jgi:hypothetical protein
VEDDIEEDQAADGRDEPEYFPDQLGTPSQDGGAVPLVRLGYDGSAIEAVLKSKRY